MYVRVRLGLVQGIIPLAMLLASSALLAAPPGGGQNQSPLCAITFSPYRPLCCLPVSFDSHASDPDGTVGSVTWDFGDGTAGSGLAISHSFGHVGAYLITCTVTDNGGLFHTCSTSVAIDAYATVDFTLEGGRWHLFSLPCNPADPAPELLFPPGTPLDGNLTRYEDGGYVTYQSFDPDEFGPLRSGEGYWLHADAPIAVSYVACCPAEPQELYYPSGGWHLLGSHRLEAIPFSVISARSSTGQVLSFEQAWLSGWVGDPLFLYSFADLGYLSVGVNVGDEESFLRPRYGYWLSTGMPNLTLIIPSP